MHLNLTPNARALHWSAPLIGKPWAPTFTCWDLVRTVQLGQFGRVMPAYELADERAPGQLRSVVQTSGWCRVDGTERQEGDVMLMRGPDGLHIGVVVRVQGDCQLLHNLGELDADGQARGCVRMDRLADLGRLHYGRFELWRAQAC